MNQSSLSQSEVEAVRKETTESGSTEIVNYKDVVFFRVPKSWLICKEHDGGIAIYEDRDGSGTLRPWTEIYEFDDTTIRDTTAHDLHDGQPTGILTERAVLSYSVHDEEENGELLKLHRWIVTVPKGTKQLRVVTFTHTVDEENGGTEETAWELQIVDLAVRSALYADASI
jgi:hypothetical protein